MKNETQNYTGLEVAIIGIACRFPGAKNWREYWENLTNARESVNSFFDKDDENQEFVNIGTQLKDKDFFDSSFFEYSKNEARLMNPMLRVFHECVWEALEDSGYNIENETDPIGLYAGGGDDFNWRVFSMLENIDKEVDPFVLSYINNKDFLASLLSYKLNLKGPSLSVNTACSTSLIAIDLACKSLLLGDAKVAMAGAVNIITKKQKGYYYEEGMISSNDGHCRAFDKDASGTINGEGAGVIVLKRLKDALIDKDHIYSIIKGSAVNNDGNIKVGFTAPSVEGQVFCIKKAQKIARVKPNTIGYVEAHGTGTKLGDSIEIEALNIAFSDADIDEKSIPIGSVKTNIGHLDAAAGIAGLIKATLSLKEKKIPPSLYFKEANPDINFNGGPFFVIDGLRDFNRKRNIPLRVGVSSFGIGGTNGHVILEEAPELEQNDDGRKYNLFTISAKTKTALQKYCKNFGLFLMSEELLNLRDMSYTLQKGRQSFRYRKALVYSNRKKLLELLTLNKNDKAIVSRDTSNSIVFVFPGQGSQYQKMGEDLYLNESSFRKEMDNGFAIIDELTGLDFKKILYSNENEKSRINETLYLQPIIFVFEYSLAKLMISLGVRPNYMIGHSIGEYVAACLAGVFSFRDALQLIVQRAKLMDTVPKGLMLAAQITDHESKKYINENISIASINSDERIVFSGEVKYIEELEEKLVKANIFCTRLNTSHAFHSKILNSITQEFKKELEKVKFCRPNQLFISNITGQLCSPDEVVLPQYWINHMLGTVQFHKGIKSLSSLERNLIFIEIGPGNSMSNLIKQNSINDQEIDTVSIIRNSSIQMEDTEFFINSIGKLWELGVNLNWEVFYNDESRRKISLPTYPFDSIPYRSEVNPLETQSVKEIFNTVNAKQNQKNKLFRNQWTQSFWLPSNYLDYNDKVVIIFSSNERLFSFINNELTKQTCHCVNVIVDENYEKSEKFLYKINPNKPDHIYLLFKQLKADNILPKSIIYTCDYSCKKPKRSALVSNEGSFFNTSGYSSLQNIARSFTFFYETAPLEINYITNGLYSLVDSDYIDPIKSISLGAIKVIPLEFQNICCRAIDISDLSHNSKKSLLKELCSIFGSIEIAIRGHYRYVKTVEEVNYVSHEEKPVLIRRGTYLITGATGGMGKLFSEYLFNNFQANLILISRGTKPVFVNSLENEGAIIEYIQADISDFNKVVPQILKAEKIFGKVNGIIHAAGVGDFSGVILNRNSNDDDKIFAPKIGGTNVLSYIFKGKNLDFFVNFSSLSSSLASFGQIAYVAANLYQDAIAELGSKSFPIISIQWSHVKNMGMAYNSMKNKNLKKGAELLEHGLTGSEVLEAFLDALFLKIPTLIITKENLKEKLSNHYNIQNHFVADGNIEYIERPELSNDYIEPKNEIEEHLILFYRAIIGVDKIGVKDDFFELGGDSLKAMNLLMRIRKELKIDLTLRDVFEKPSVELLSREIVKIKEAQQTDINSKNKVNI